MKKTFKHLLVSGIISGLVYFGFIEGVEGAQRIFQFFVWVMCVPLGLLCNTKNGIAEMAKWPPIPAWRIATGKLISWTALVVLVWTGNVFTGLGWGFYMLCSALASSSIKAFRKSQPS